MKVEHLFHKENEFRVIEDPCYQTVFDLKTQYEKLGLKCHLNSKALWDYSDRNWVLEIEMPQGWRKVA